MKVVLASMAPYVGGAEVAAERLGLGLKDAGHDVLMLLGRRGAVFERMGGAGLDCLHSPMSFTDKWHWLRYSRDRRGIRRALRDFGPDVVHSNDLPTHQIVGDAARGLGVPRVCHHRFPFEGAAVDWFNKAGAERHLFVSGALMRELRAASARLEASPGAVVHDGLPMPPSPGDIDRRRAREQLGLPIDRVLVAIAGQVIPRKGVADLIRAWPLLPGAARDPAELLIVGDDLLGRGAYRLEMERLALDLGVPARFVGFREDVDRWLTASDVAVVPSHVEPLGNAVLEAMAHGLPVVGSDVGGIPEMVAHEETGLLVPPGAPEALAAALARLLVDEGARRRFGTRGRSRCEDRFGLKAHVSAVLLEYEAALRTRTGPRTRPGIASHRARASS